MNSHSQYIGKVVVVCLFSKQKTQQKIMLTQLQFHFYVHNSTIVYIGGYVSGYQDKSDQHFFVEILEII